MHGKCMMQVLNHSLMVGRHHAALLGAFRLGVSGGCASPPRESRVSFLKHGA